MTFQKWNHPKTEFQRGNQLWKLRKPFSAWNKNLTKEIDKRVKRQSLSLKSTIKSGNYDKKFSNKNFIKNNAHILTPKLSYIYGVMLGDGYLNIKDRLINLDTKDKDFASFFYNVLFCWSGITPRFYKYNHTYKYKNKVEIKQYYRVDLNSVDAVNILKNMKLVDITSSNDEEIIGLFLRGLFDSEGCVDSTGYDIEFGITNKKVINVYIFLLKRLDIITNKIMIEKEKKIDYKTSYSVNIKKNIVNYILFLKRVGITIERKRKLVEEKISLYCNGHRNKILKGVV